MRRLYPWPAVVRAMKRQEVILKTYEGKITWIQAAHILRMTPRNLRRLKRRYERDGRQGLLDQRTGRPSPKRASPGEAKRIVRLYREIYWDYNVRHFHQTITKKHEVNFSYTFVKKLLQKAGLVPKQKKRGTHRLKRERKACVGEMLHIDGSKHVWLALRPQEEESLISVIDDATSKCLYAQLVEAESAHTILSALKEVVQVFGIPMSLYNDRAGWAFITPKAGQPADKENLTRVGQVLAHLGIEHIPSYSPQARGRSERAFGTFQDRLVSELRVAGIRTMEPANRFLRDVFIPDYNRRFGCEPKDATHVFVSAGDIDLDQVFCIEDERTVAKDNTVVLAHVRMQIEKQPGRATCAGRRVVVRRHLDGTHTIWQGLQCWGRYDPQGRPLKIAPKRSSIPVGLPKRRAKTRVPQSFRTHATAVQGQL